MPLKGFTTSSTRCFRAPTSHSVDASSGFEKMKNALARSTRGSLAKLNEVLRILFFRNEANPGESLRGRPTNQSVRDGNLHALCVQYNNTPPAQRNRLQYLLLVQLHLSQTAFAKLLEEYENDTDEEADTLSSSQRSGNSQPSSSSATRSRKRAHPSSPSSSQHSLYGIGRALDLRTDSEDVCPSLPQDSIVRKAISKIARKANSSGMKAFNFLSDNEEELDVVG